MATLGFGCASTQPCILLSVAISYRHMA